MPNTYALDLEDASSQRASAPDSASLSFTGSFTLEAWIKLETTPASGEEWTIVGKYGTTAFSDWVMTYLNDAGSLYIRGIYTNAGGSAKAVAASTSNTVTTGTWTHVAITYNSAGGANSGKFYRDGVEITTATQDADTLRDNNDATYIGFGNNQGGDDYFDGIIDEVRIWNVVRTGTQISDNYNCELVGDESGLVAYWKLENNGLDETANNNDLTANNGTFVTDVPFAGGLCGAAGTSRRFTDLLLMGAG